MSFNFTRSNYKKSSNLWTYFMLLLFFPSMFAYSQAGLRNLFFNSASNIIRLDFTPPGPTPYATGQANTSPAEGIAHFEDEFGNVLFWVISSGVYDQFNVQMPGSFGIFANASAAEINIAPVPGNPNQYYILYVQGQAACSEFGGNPLHYSIVDMTLNGGLGDVINLNSDIDTGTFSEGMEIVRIPCSDAYWFVVYECNVGFKRFLIDETGINPGEIILPYPQPPGTDGRGEIDYHRGKLGACFAWSSRVFIGDFDPVTGELTNPINLDDGAFSNSPFGVEFSPSANKMYFTLWYSGGIPNIFQYDIASGVYNSIYTSSVQLGEIELGSDGRLYVIQDGGTDIIVIENPDDDINVFSTITVPAGSMGLGISDHIQSDIFQEEVYGGDTLCVAIGDEITLTPIDVSVDYEWVDNDDPSGTILAVSPTYTFTIGSDETILTATSVTGTGCIDIIEYTVIPYPDLDAGPDVGILAGESIQLGASSTIASQFIWFPGATLDDPFSANPIATPTETTTYYVSSNNGICFSSDTVVVEIIEKVEVEEAICAQENAPVTIAVADSLVNVFWTTADDTDVILGTGTTLDIVMGEVPVTYRAEADNPTTLGGWIVLLTVVPTPDVNAGADATILLGESIQLNDAATGGTTFSWTPTDGLDDPTAQSPNASPEETTTYTVTTYYDDMCESSDEVTISIINEFVQTDSICVVVDQAVTIATLAELTNVQWTNVDAPSDILGTDVNLSVTGNATNTVYHAVGENPAGDIINMYVTVLANPVVNAGMDEAIRLGDNIELGTTLSAGSIEGTFSWSPAQFLDNPTSPNPVATPIETTEFTVVHTTDGNCTFTDEVTIRVEQKGQLLVPSAFSPNGDGKNDILRIIPVNIAQLTEFKVFNRWGEKVFETRDINQGWNGVYQNKVQDIGVYVYFATAISTQGDPVYIQGNVTIIK